VAQTPDRGTCPLQVHAPNKVAPSPDERKHQITAHPKKGKKRNVVGLLMSQTEVHPAAREMPVLQMYNYTCKGVYVCVVSTRLSVFFRFDRMPSSPGLSRLLFQDAAHKRNLEARWGAVG